LLSKLAVMPVKTGIQRFLSRRDWIPAFAGMTTLGFEVSKDGVRRAVLSNLDTSDYV
jgi:hypothetical protein